MVLPDQLAERFTPIIRRPVHVGALPGTGVFAAPIFEQGPEHFRIANEEISIANAILFGEENPARPASRPHAGPGSPPRAEAEPTASKPGCQESDAVGIFFRAP